ncbi:LPD1 domain-containing protein [Lysinibacillus xylanilyticus]|uniref:LPD1 domain-containing protein n=1 Tax=Lysinibacillus xylanilyticus TaxID=582475 RepID=UPI00381A228A
MSGTELLHGLFQMMEEIPLSKVVFSNEVNTKLMSKKHQDISRVIMPAITDFSLLDAFKIISSPIEEEVFDASDVRTDVQRKQDKKISYDCGEKIGGARKDIEEWKRKFLDNPSKEVLSELAEHNIHLATELATKKNIFSWFDMEGLFNKGVEIRAAYGMSLLIRRLPTNSKNLDLQEYMDTLSFISGELQRITTFNQLETTIKRFEMLATPTEDLQWRENRFSKYSKELDLAMEEQKTYGGNLEGNIKKLLFKVRMEFCYVMGILMQNQFGLNKLGSFSDLLQSYKKYRSFINSTEKFTSWTQYFEENKIRTEKAAKNKGPRKSVWERELPIEPKRLGGREIEEIRLPEQFQEFFGLRAVEFGHWMSDDYGRAHLINSSRALVDLADILSIKEYHISLGFELAFAFGARGKGKALGHYERGFNVINLTKEKGSLGIAAHEWFHSYDRFLKKTLAITDEFELLTEGLNLHELPNEVIDAFQGLMSAIKDGESTDYVEIDPQKRYNIRDVTISEFKALGCDMQKFVDERMKAYDERIKNFLSSYVSESSRKKAEVKYARKRVKDFRAICGIAAQIHKELTREEVYRVPYTSNHTLYYNTSLKLDKKGKKYWSSNVELTARAFEAYIDSKLKEKNMRSDYLVYGLDYIYPKNDELQRINKAMQQFLDVTLPFLRETSRK